VDYFDINEKEYEMDKKESEKQFEETKLLFSNLGDGLRALSSKLNKKGYNSEVIQDDKVQQYRLEIVGYKSMVIYKRNDYYISIFIGKDFDLGIPKDLVNINHFNKKLDNGIVTSFDVEKLLGEHYKELLIQIDKE